jgi:hypothetical protein
MRAGESQLLAQQLHQRLLGRDVESALLAVDDESEFRHGGRILV